MIHRNIKPNRPKVDSNFTKFHFVDPKFLFFSFEDCQNSSAHVSWDLTEYSWNENDQIQYRIILDEMNNLNDIVIFLSLFFSR